MAQKVPCCPRQIPPFYVAFTLAPLASNASEFIASFAYASKKSRKTITVALAALEGAACMNNTFCLSIFMGLCYFKQLACAAAHRSTPQHAAAHRSTPQHTATRCTKLQHAAARCSTLQHAPRTRRARA